MSGFESIVGQNRPIRILTAFLQNGTIPHALLFTGIEGVGKKSVADIFATACNCTGDISENKFKRGSSRAADKPSSANRQPITNPCGRCKSCRKIESRSHPDIIRIEPSGVFIKIDQIRALCHSLAMKPYEASIRMVLISDAQAMNPAAGNALLKVLEEPPTGTILILVANHTADLLPTIVSRCRHIRFNPISRKDMESVLVSSHGLDPPNATIVAAMAGGSLSRALHMYRTNWINRRNWLIRELDSLSSKTISRLLAFSEHLAQNKADLPDALEIMKFWLRDLVIGKFYPEKIIHQDLAENVHQTAQKMSTTSLISKIETIQSTQNAIQAGTNLRLAMETMVLKLSRI